MNLIISQRLVQILRKAEHIVVLTGAGISAESGIPTFRGAQTGLWSNYNPEELATQNAFQTNPDLVWHWYRWRQEIINLAKPNPGHIALAKMESIVTNRGSNFTLITQNIDGMHQCSGNHNIIELHGNINRRKCSDCDMVDDEYNSNTKGECLHCIHCGGLLRPDVIWFGENLSSFKLQASLEAVQVCDIFFSIGTSAAVQPAASLPVIALKKGATLVELNPNNTYITTLTTFSLRGPSGEILPQLVEMAWPDIE